MFAALATVRFWLKASPYIAVAIALLCVVLWVRGLRASVVDLEDKNASLSQALLNETQARQRDVAGLTALSTGLAKVAVDTKADAKILQENVKDANAPVSRQLADYLNGLRASDAAGKPSAAASPSR